MGPYRKSSTYLLYQIINDLSEVQLYALDQNALLDIAKAFDHLAASVGETADCAI